ncbi:carboxylic ester hydrolase [Amyelois transitella]|uniref:carboxylic ester hydrolase n=1 Tax=Amyelois transitella TaxID=680683 RepID=UPI00298F85DC|nr:carboxylic ester hydrolase [Amyelois transitella]
MWKFCCILLVVHFVCGFKEKDVKEVRTPQGPVRGYRDPDRNIFIFRSIPYATAPTGRNRFRAPLPPPVWLETFDAVDKDIICPQNLDKTKNIMLNGREKIDENCLVASVYVPDTTEKKLPVVVYVHGGGFQIGYGDALTPKQFVEEKNVIAVTFNYRLGVHGFLCLGTKLAPGNAGMKDQVALLRWVQKNIASFGGNPDDVTLTGYSAGSAAVDLLLLSPSAKGLFHRAIPESGTNIASWANTVDPLEKAQTFAKELNFDSVDDVYTLESYYVSHPLESLTSHMKMDEKDSTFGFSPCIERSDTGEEPFLIDSPLNILKSGKFTKVPLLYGFANMEGLLRVMLFETWKDDMNKKISDFLPADLTFDNEEQREEVATDIKKYYFGDKPVDESTMLGYIDYFTDVMFAYPALRSLKLQKEAGNNQIYLYEYSFVDEGGYPSGYKNLKVNGANHCGQTITILDWPTFLGPTKFSEEFKNIKRTLSDMWYNFITTNKPVPEGSSYPAWPPMGNDWSPHMSLGNTVELRGSLLLERTRFWDRIYERHYRNPVPPPGLTERNEL